MRRARKGLVINNKRLAEMRKERGLEQSQLAAIMTEKVAAREGRNPDEVRGLSVSNISTWETGRRPVAQKYEEILSEILGVGIPYLYGVTEDRTIQDVKQANIAKYLKPENSFLDELAEAEARLEDYKIKPTDLKFYDGKPVYVEYPLMSAESGWGIYNAYKRSFSMRDGHVPVSESFQANYYAKEPYYRIDIADVIRGKKSLTYSQMMEQKRVLVLFDSPNKILREHYSGWYVHNKRKTGLISLSTSEVLPYEGLNFTYRAYSPVY